MLVPLPAASLLASALHRLPPRLAIGELDERREQPAMLGVAVARHFCQLAGKPGLPLGPLPACFALRKRLPESSLAAHPCLVSALGSH